MDTDNGTRWLTEDEQRAWRIHLDVSRLLSTSWRRDLQPFGLTINDYEILVNLSESADRRMRMSDLASATLQSKSRLSHQITRMEKAELVRRESCESDKRGLFAVLTEHGWRDHAQGRPPPCRLGPPPLHRPGPATGGAWSRPAPVAETRQIGGRICAGRARQGARPGQRQASGRLKPAASGSRSTKRAPARAPASRQRAAMPHRHITGDGEPQPGAALVPAARPVQPDEPLEDPLPLLRGHPLPVVGDDEHRRRRPPPRRRPATSLPACRCALSSRLPSTRANCPRDPAPRRPRALPRPAPGAVARPLRHFLPHQRGQSTPVPARAAPPRRAGRAAADPRRAVWSRTVSSTAPSRSSSSGWAAPTSSWVRSEAIGLRSSCEASATNRRWRSTEASSAASVSLVVRASRAISSRESGSGTRRERSVLARDRAHLLPDALDGPQRPPGHQPGHPGDDDQQQRAARTAWSA